GATGRFALTVSLRGYRMNRVDCVFPLQELIDRSSLAGFDADRQLGPSRGFFGKALPPFSGVFELKVRNQGTCRINNHHAMVIFGPIETGVMREVFPEFHASCLSFLHRGAVMRRPDTRSLAGYCSLRR